MCICLISAFRTEASLAIVVLLTKDSVALVHQTIVVDKFRLEEKLSRLPKKFLTQIEAAIDYVMKD